MAVVADAPRPAPPGPQSRFLFGLVCDWAFKALCCLAACAPLVLLGLIVAVLYGESLPGIGEVGGAIVTSETWRPKPTMVVEDPTDPDSPEVEREPRIFGGASFIYGTIVTAALAMLIAVPLGVGTAAYLSEIAAPAVKRVGSFLVELLAAIPSVVYGFWGVNFLAPPLASLFHWMGSNVNSGGKGLLASGIILAIMVVPYVAAITYDVCQAVPSSQRQGSLALGATRWQTISRVVIPYAQPGIIGGCFLALGRALGETMAVVMLIGNTADIRPLPFGVGYTIPSVLATELKNTESDAHYGALMVLALLLFGVTILMNVAARVLIWRMKNNAPAPTTQSQSPWRSFLWPVGIALFCGFMLLNDGRAILGRTFQAFAFFTPLVGGTIGFLGAVLLLFWVLFTLLNMSEKYRGARTVNRVMTWVLSCRVLIWRMKNNAPAPTTQSQSPWRSFLWPVGIALFCGFMLLNDGRAILGGTFQAFAFFTPLVGGTVGFFGAVMLLFRLLFTLLNMSEKYLGAQTVNRVMTWVLSCALVVTCAPLFLILGYLVYRGVGGLSVNLFISTPYGPNGLHNAFPGSFILENLANLCGGGDGLFNAFAGSFIIVGLASLIAIPVGLLGGIYLAEYRTRLFGTVVRFASELLTGVPSIVVGVFIYALVRFLIKDLHWLSDKEQFSGWAGVAALSIMMIPIVIRSSEESLKLVPGTLRNASHALGAYHWQTVLRVSVPAAMSAIITGVFLAIARIAGETAPLLMTAFGNENLTLSPGDQMGFLPLYIFRYATEGVQANESKAWAASLVLVGFIMVLNVGVRILAGRRGVQASRAD